MPAITFNGFSVGSSVAISAVQGGNNASGSVTTWGQENLANLNILQIAPAELVAPVGIWFEAIEIAGFDVSGGPGPDEVYDPSAHAITYIWDFGDPGTFQTPLNIPAAWNNRTVDYGKKAYHVFDSPGIYTVRLWGIDRSGNTGERIVQVTVLDPGAVYAGGRTICVSQSGNFAGAPPGAQQVTSLPAAQTAYRSLGQSGRLLLRAGEVFQNSYEINSPQVNHRVGSFGTGPKPVLLPPQAGPGVNSSTIFSFRNGNGVLHSAFYGLRFQGEWDAATETGDPRGSAIFYSTHNAADGWTSLIYQCEFSGLGALDPSQSEVDAFTSGVVDCDITNWQDYGMRIGGQFYRKGQRFALVGSALHQKQDACDGGHGKIGLGNDHGPFRYSDVQDVIISACDFYSANSWPPGGGIQPCLRLAQGADVAANDGNYYFQMNRVVCEGGDIMAGIDGQNDGAPEMPGNHVFDTFLLVGNYTSRHWLGVSYGGSTIRNGLMIEPQMNKLVGGLAFLDFSQQNPQLGNANVPVDVYNCTFLNQQAGPVAVSADDGNFNILVIENNVIHEPNLATPNTPFAPIGLGQGVDTFTPRSRGRRTGPEKVTATLGASVPPGGTVTMPYPAGTSAADYSPAGRHTVLLGGNGYHFSYRGDVALAFGGASITVQNLSGGTWAAGSALKLGLDQQTLVTDTSYAAPASVPLPTPQAGSSALTATGEYVSHTDFTGAPRGSGRRGAI